MLKFDFSNHRKILDILWFLLASDEPGQWLLNINDIKRLPRRPWPFNFTESAWFQCFLTVNTKVFIFLLFVYVSLISGMIDRKITQLIFIIKKFVKMNDSNFCWFLGIKKRQKRILGGRRGEIRVQNRTREVRIDLVEWSEVTLLERGQR